MGGTAKKIANVGGRAFGDVMTGGLAELGKKDPYYGLITNPSTGAAAFNPGLFGSGQTNPYIGGPFSLDPNQLSGDKADINNLGQKQYTDTLGAIDANATAQNQRVADLMKSSLPDIAENAQAAHLYDSTGYGQEVARQQAQLASGVASQAAQDKLSALSGRQGFETGALQRGQSLEDFINQANVAKTIGAQMAPQPASGKQNFGTVAQGVGALAPYAKLAKA